MNKQELKRWRVDGGEALRYDYDISKGGIVIDLGVYKGDWINRISRHGCFIYGFEPVKQFFKMARSRFAGNTKIKLYNCAVGGENRQDSITIQKDGSGLFGEVGKREKVQVRSIKDIWVDLNDPFVELIKINVEGAEYEILELALDIGLHLRMRDIQVQFHDFKGLNGIKRRKLIRSKLSETHHLTYDYPFVWENWRLNG